MTIPELHYKIKAVREALETREIFTAILIVLVGVTAFGLGRLSLLESKTQGIRVSNALPSESPQTASALSASPPARGGEVRGGGSVKDEGSMMNDFGALAPGGQVVASKSGSKYHYPWCSGAQRIAEANKVWFVSVEEARKAGYTPAGNCKGLK